MHANERHVRTAVLMNVYSQLFLADARFSGYENGNISICDIAHSFQNQNHVIAPKGFQFRFVFEHRMIGAGNGILLKSADIAPYVTI